MKRILLRSLPDPRFPRGDPQYESMRVDYRSLIEQAIRVPLDRQQGATIDEMRRGIRVLDALDKVTWSSTDGDILELEDADWQFLKTKVEKMPWAMVDRRFVMFYDEVMEATDAVHETMPGSDGVATV